MKRQRVGGCEKIRGEFFGDMPVGEVSIRQRMLRPVKKLAVMLGVMPKTTGGKKWLKRIVFGGLVEMPVEIGPHPSGIRSDKLNATRCDSVNLTRQAVTSEFHGAGITQNGKDEGSLYRERYEEPERISSSRPDTEYKVIYCAATPK